MKSTKQTRTVVLIYVRILLFCIGIPQVASAVVIDTTYTDIQPQSWSFGPTNSFPLDFSLTATNATSATWTDFHLSVGPDPLYPSENISNLSFTVHINLASLPSLTFNGDSVEYDFATGNFTAFGKWSLDIFDILVPSDNTIIVFNQPGRFSNPDNVHFIVTAYPTVPEIDIAASTGAIMLIGGVLTVFSECRRRPVS